MTAAASPEDPNAKANPDQAAGAEPRDTPTTNGDSDVAEKTTRIDQLEKERDEARDQALRARAELVNYQKRVKQQAETDRLYYIGNFAHDMLDVLDNLDRATEALRASGAEGVVSGLEIVRKQLLTTMAKYGVEPIEALDQPFDPNYHDALMQQPSREHPEGTVVAEIAKGYKIHDRVLRPTKVAVSAKP